MSFLFKRLQVGFSPLQIELDRLQMRFLCVLFVFGYGFLIDFLFGLVCHRFREVQGYQCGVVEWGWSLLLILFAVAPSFFMPLAGKRPSAVILWIVYFSHVVPAIITFPYLVSVQSFQDVIWPALISILYIFTSLVVYVRLIKPPLIVFPGWVFAVCILSFAVFSLIVLIKTFGFNFSPPALNDVYGVRATYKEINTPLGHYVAVIGGFAISPFLILAAAKLKKSKPILSFSMFSLAITLSYVIYASSGLKSVAFSCFGSLILFFLFRRVRNVGLSIALAVPICVTGALALFFIFNLEYPAMHLTRRVFLVPGMNVSYFYDYMTLVGGGWADAPKVISMEYYGTAGSANAGLFGDALARYGFLGLAINIPIFIFILKFSDFVARYNDLDFYCALFALSAYALSNSSVTTVFVTYGYIFVAFSALISGQFLERRAVSNR